jgi:hypothetical protein
VHEVAHLLLDHGPHLHAAEEIPRGKDEPEELVINVDDPSDPRHRHVIEFLRRSGEHWDATALARAFSGLGPLG